MKKVSLLGNAIALTLLSCIAMATDFHTLITVQTASATTQDKKLSEPEDRETCDATIVGNAGGFALCAFLSSGASGDTASYTIESKQPVMGARFIQVVN